MGQIPTYRVYDILEREGFVPSNLTSPRIDYKNRIMGYMNFNMAEKMTINAGFDASLWRGELYDLYSRVNLKMNQQNATRLQPRMHGTQRMWATGCRCVRCGIVTHERTRKMEYKRSIAAQRKAS
jgi:hypothetical protein